MRKTVVTFSLRVPVLAPGSTVSAALDELVRTWQSLKGVIAVHTQWKALPRPDTDPPLRACVDAVVEIGAAISKELQRLYTTLTREANKEPERLASRTCNLIDLFG
jgi:hypothetical protein